VRDRRIAPVEHAEAAVTAVGVRHVEVVVLARFGQPAGSELAAQLGEARGKGA
jgi:hypothetical protein